MDTSHMPDCAHGRKVAIVTPAQNLTPQDALDKLTKTVRTEHEAVGRAFHNMLHHALAAGDALILLQAEIQPGAWEVYCRENCGLSPRTGQVYIKLSRSRSVIEAQRAAPPSIRAALRLLQGPPSTRPQKASKKATAAPGLTSLAWSCASVADRKRFLNQISLAEVFEAMPPSWRDEIRRRITSQNIAQARLGAANLQQLN